MQTISRGSWPLRLLKISLVLAGLGLVALLALTAGMSLPAQAEVSIMYAEWLSSLVEPGIAAFEGQRFKEAVGYWRRLIAVLPAEDPSRDALQGGIDRALEQLAAKGETLPDEPVAVAAATGAQLKVRVELAAKLKDQVQPGDTLLGLVAKHMQGPDAFKRLTQANKLADVNRISVGHKINIPRDLLKHTPATATVTRLNCKSVIERCAIIGKHGTSGPLQITNKELIASCSILRNILTK